MRQKQVIKFKSKRNHYNADACIVWCFDNRFDALLKKTKESLGFKHTDDIKIAGGAMNLAGRGIADDKEKIIEYLANQVEKSIKLHHAPLVILMLHKDCGAYKAIGLPLEGENENELLEQDLKEASDHLSEYLSRRGYRPKIKMFIADFDSLREV